MPLIVALYLGFSAEMSSVDDGSDAGNAIDDDNTTSAISKDGDKYILSTDNPKLDLWLPGSVGHSFPYYILDLGRNIRLTKVSLLGGDNPQDNPIMNLDVRFGTNSNSGFDPNSKITNNDR